MPRGRRGKDGKVYRVTPPWDGRSKQFTQEFEAFALTLMREMPVKRAREMLGKSDSRHNGHPQAIQYVGINMSAAYATGTNANSGNARVVYEKFHVIQNVEEACDQVPMAENRSVAGKRELLERTRWMWLKN